MKRTFVGVLAAALLLAPATSQGISVDFAPAAQNVSVGVPVNVALVISGLGNGAAPSLSTFDLDVTFDGSILSFLSGTFGDPVLGEQLDLFGLGSLASATPGLGVVNVFELSLDSPADLNALQAGSFTLATLTFSTLSAGFSTLGISVKALGDANGDPLTAAITGGGVTSTGPTAVPEPASFLLVLVGLIVLAVARLAFAGAHVSERRNLTEPKLSRRRLQSGEADRLKDARGYRNDKGPSRSTRAA